HQHAGHDGEGGEVVGQVFLAHREVLEGAQTAPLSNFDDPVDEMKSHGHDPRAERENPRAGRLKGGNIVRALPPGNPECPRRSGSFPQSAFLAHLWSRPPSLLHPTFYTFPDRPKIRNPE